MAVSRGRGQRAAVQYLPQTPSVPLKVRAAPLEGGHMLNVPARHVYRLTNLKLFLTVSDWNVGDG